MAYKKTYLEVSEKLFYNETICYGKYLDIKKLIAAPLKLVTMECYEVNKMLHIIKRKSQANVQSFTFSPLNEVTCVQNIICHARSWFIQSS